MAKNPTAILYDEQGNPVAVKAGDTITIPRNVAHNAVNTGAHDAELIAYVKEAFGLEISRDKADKLLRYRDLISLLEGVLTIQETNFQKIIVQDPSPYSDKRTIEVLYPEPKGI